MEIPGQDRVPHMYLPEVNNVRSYFNKPNKPSFKFEKIIGTGARGFAVEMRIKDDSDPSLPRPLTGGLSPRNRSLSGPSPRNRSLSGPSLAGPSLTGPSLTGPSLSGPSLAGPSLAGPSLAGPSLAGPSPPGSSLTATLSSINFPQWISSSAAGPLLTRLSSSPSPSPLIGKSRTSLLPIGPSRTVPIFTGPTLTAPTLTNPTLTAPTLTGPTLTGPSLTGPSLTGPSLTGLVPTRKKVERFVMKRAFERKDDETISSEIEFLRRLRGAQNIQQLYHLPNETEELKLDYLPGPTLFTEWIPNGQIRDLVMTRPEWDHPLPNRMLWRCFLCMCHMLIAMAWPPEGNQDAPSAKPELPSTDPSGVRPQKSTIRHNDINIGNIMFGDFDSTAHHLVPILKLIDFGQASNSTEAFQYTEESAVRQNMFRIAEVMINLIGGAVMMTQNGIKDMEVTINGEKHTIRSRARDLDGLNRGYGANNAIIQKHKEWLDNLDTDLRDILVFCLATDENVRPTLEQLYEQVRRNVTEKTRMSYAGKRWQDNESDESLRTISRNLIVKPHQ